jgi:hypothetical protein
MTAYYPSLRKARIAKSPGRVWLLLVSVCCLAAMAGVLSVRAFAEGNDYYCAPCVLPSSGIPAVSPDRYTFFSNYLTTAPWSSLDFWEQVYYYSPSLNQQWCKVTTFGTTVSSSSCGTGGNSADARCHLVMGTGPATATCKGSYSTN